MIIVENTNEISRDGHKQSVVCSIAVSGKSFRVTSDGLYKDKPQTIIRELACNAYDAHIAAVKAGTLSENIPFDVHLPSIIEPHFSIRDYGTGMSQEFMTTIFPQYFVSTKSNSNDYIGAMGLGSKSPLSYCELFTIVSWVDGQQSTYQIFWNEDDLPEVSLVETIPSTERNGVLVTVPVLRHDVSVFCNKAQEILKLFDVIPNILNAPSNFAIKPYEWLFETPQWKYHNRALSYYTNKNAIAHQGNVEYAISPEAMGDISDVENAILSCGNIHFFFNIGDLSVTASREGLSYKTKTIENIRKAVMNFALTFKGKIEHYIANQPSLWHAHLARTELNTTLNHGDLNQKLQLRAWQYSGGLLNDNIKMKMVNYPGLTIKQGSPYRGKTRVLRDVQLYNGELAITPEKRLHFFKQDEQKSTYLTARIYSYISDSTNGCSGLYFLSGPDDVMEKFITDLTVDSGAIRKVSDLPQVDRPKRTIVKEKVYSFSSCYFREGSIDFEAGGYYIELSKNKAKINGVEQRYFYDTVAKLLDLDIIADETVLVGASNRFLNKFVKHPKWKSLTDHVIEYLTSKIDLKVETEQTNRIRQYCAWASSKTSWARDLIETGQLTSQGKKWTLADFDKEKPFGMVANELHALYQSVKKDVGVQQVDSIRPKLLQLAGTYGVNVEDHTAPVIETDEFINRWQEMFVKYPLFDVFTASFHQQLTSTQNSHHMFDYIKFIDGVTK